MTTPNACVHELRDTIFIHKVAEFFGVKPGDGNRLLAGQWRPSKQICRRLGLKVVYAISDQPDAAGNGQFR
jgi:hypothetical protein